MFRYLAERVAHEKNPYPPGSREWVRYNEGFIEMSTFKMPTRWALVSILVHVVLMLVLGVSAVALGVSIGMLWR